MLRTLRYMNAIMAYMSMDFSTLTPTGCTIGDVSESFEKYGKTAITWKMLKTFCISLL